MAEEEEDARRRTLPQRMLEVEDALIDHNIDLPLEAIGRYRGGRIGIARPLQVQAALEAPVDGGVLVGEISGVAAVAAEPGQRLRRGYCRSLCPAFVATGLYEVTNRIFIFLSFP